MKKTTKLISVILAVVMVLSVIPFTAFGSVIPDGVTTIEGLISSNNLATLVDYLFTKLNETKDPLVATALKIVYSAMKDKDDAEKSYFALSTIVDEANKDVLTLTPEESATILIKFLNKNLPGWTADMDTDKINGITNILGINIDLSSVDGVLNTIRQLDKTGVKAVLLTCGDASEIKVSVFDGISTGNGKNLQVIYSLFQFVTNNMELIKKAISGNLDLGVIEAVYNPDEGEKGINNIMKNLPTLLREKIYGLVKNADKAYADSDYKNYTADQLLAVAFSQLISGDEETVVSTTEANAIVNRSIYATLAEYADDIYASFALEPLNNGLRDALIKASNYNAEVKAQFNTSYTFTEATFANAFAGAKTTGILGQFNNFLVTILNTVLSAKAKTALNLTAGGNENLNTNLTKLCKYVLPILAKVPEKDLGVNLSAFTAAKVANMSLEDMAVAVLKLFFDNWFGTNVKYNATSVNKATTLEQLGVLSIYYTITNTEWLHLDGIDAQLASFNTKIANIETYATKDKALEFILDMASAMGFGALKHNAATTHFNVTAAASWGYKEMYDAIADWAINYINGMPAVVKQHISSECSLSTYDPCYGDPYYKLNVILNELVNFSFLSNVNDATFKLDLGTLIEDAIAGNLFDFNLVGALDVFKVNKVSGNILNMNIIPGAISLINRLLSSLFEHNCGDDASVSYNTVKSCTKETTTKYTYCNYNGAYTAAPQVTQDKTVNNHKYVTYKVIKAATCTATGSNQEKCTICGNITTVTTQKLAHNFTRVVIPATCVAPESVKLTCTLCKTVQTNVNPNSKPTGKHTYVNGVCTVCKAKDPSFVEYVLGNLDDDINITAGDARLALRYSVGLEKFTATQIKAADLDLSGKVDAADARAILRVSVNLDKIVNGVYIAK